MLVTNLGNGEVIGVGPNCMSAYAWALARSMPETTAPAAAVDSTESVADNGESAATKPRRSRSRSTQLTVVPEGANDTGEAQPPVDDAAD